MAFSPQPTPGNDTITGDIANDVIDGLDGNDVIDGGGGNDKLTGGAGNDDLNGNIGNDILIGGSGDDTYTIDSAKDKITESITNANGGGHDRVKIVGSGFTIYTLGANLDDLDLSGATGNINGKGNDLANMIIGNSGSNVLDGGKGADTLIGGDGDDTYIQDDPNDVIQEQFDQGEDTLKTSVAVTNALSYVETYVFTGKGNWAFFGDGSANHAIGGAGVDLLDGGDGDDTLDGGKNADFLRGGLGDDIYVMDNIADRAFEKSGEGTDRIQATVSIDLSVNGPNVENVQLLGKGAINATGDGADNILDGNAGKNTLDGGAGNDTLRGGDGDDTYIVESSGDIVSETNGGKGGGKDLVKSSVSFTLGANLETLTLTGSNNINGTGNGLVNTITGNGGNNVLDGGAGADILIGGLGNDTYIVDEAKDVVKEGKFGGTNDTIQLAAGASTTSFNVKTGSSATPTYSLAKLAEVENLDFSAATVGFTLIGNKLANHLTGGDGNDKLMGSLGNDVIDGGAGFDSAVFSGNWAGYQITLNADGSAIVTDIDTSNGNEGVDTLSHVERLQFQDRSIVLPYIDLAALALAKGFRIDGAVFGVLSGRSVSSAGDVNGDGFGDLILGAHFADPLGRTDAGSSYVIFGKASGLANMDLANLSATDGFRIDGAVARDYSGRSVSSAGDINSDGFDDLIVGAVFASPLGKAYAGSSYVIFGKASGLANIDLANLSATGGFRIDGAAAHEYNGQSVSSAGDINGDGFDDLITGARSASPSGRVSAGSSYVIFGKSSGLTNIDLLNLTTTEGFRIDGAATFDRSGSFVSSAGDVNGDGFGDLIVGARYADPLGKSDAGSSYVIFGKSSGFINIDLASLAAADGFRIDGAAAGDFSGRSISSAGDVNGDGFDDLIVGASNASPAGRNYAGSSYVIFGKFSGLTNVDLAGLSPPDGFRIDGAAASGGSVSSAGDVNGDGFDDVIVGAYVANYLGRFYAGSSYVIFGKSSGLTNIDLANLAAADGFRIDGEAAGDYSGFSVSSAGDINGDGFDDLVVGAPLADPSGRSDAGSSYVIYGGDFLAKVTHLGNALTGTTSADIMVGTSGNDNISGGGGGDSIRAGSGDDVITIDSLDFSRISGGLGADMLIFATGAGAIDFSDLDNNAATKDVSRIEGIEIFDFTNGAANTIVLSVADLLSLDVDIRDAGGNASLDNVLRILGDATDSLDLDLGAGASQWAIDGSLTLAGFTIYSTNNPSDALAIAIANGISVI